MTSPDDVSVPDVQVLALEPEDLDGHSIDELSDYLDAGRTPPDSSIEGSPSCQIALTALARLRTISRSLLEADASDEEPRDDSWVASILATIGLEARAGRSIPFAPPTPTADLVVTEGAVRGLIRSAGDSTDGLLIGKVHLEGDVTIPGEPITVQVDASALWGQNIHDAAAVVRRAIGSALLRHTELNVVGIDVRVHDVYRPRPAKGETE